jgi:hypothetical protein
MGSGEQSWPEWWSWELELTPHVLKRMEDRDFNEVDLRQMLEHTLRYRPDAVDGRGVIDVRHGRRRWEIIVEPDDIEHLLVVVTAYPITR